MTRSCDFDNSILLNAYHLLAGIIWCCLFTVFIYVLYISNREANHVIHTHQISVVTGSVMADVHMVITVSSYMVHILIQNQELKV